MNINGFALILICQLCGESITNEFDQMWVYLSSTPLFHLTLTVVSFMLASRLFEHFDENPLFNHWGP